MRTKATAVALAIAALAIAALAAPASASPGAGSISAPDGSATYMVTPVDRDTVVTKIAGSDHTAQVKTRLQGSFEVPAVAGVEGGLSRDGKTLVLGGHPGPHVSQFVVLDTRTLRVRRLLSLHGTYKFDALSPDTSTLYVIRFLSRDGTHYAVQALDMTKREPMAHTVVEKGEPGEAMSGTALTRTTGGDGNWVYTLYDGAEGAPFVHALSTVDKVTVCIDLDALEGRHDLATLGLELSTKTHTLAVTAPDGPLAVVNTETFEVTTPPEPPKAARADTPTQRKNDPATPIWLIAGTLGLALTAATKFLLTTRKPRQT